MNNAERQRSWRARRKAEGYKMVTVWLDPDVAVALDKHLANADAPQAERQRLINELLREELK